MSRWDSRRSRGGPRSLVVAAWFAAAALVGPGLVDRCSAADYYVSASADSCGSPRPGTRSAPYCSITAALAAHHAAGTRIIVLPGVYREQVTVSFSGQANNPLFIQAAPEDGKPVVIDGSDDFADPSLWTPVAGSVWVAASVNWVPVQVFADGARLAPSTVLPEQLPNGRFTYVPGSGLFVNLGGDNPGQHQAAVGRRPYGFYLGNRSWLSISGFTITRCENRNVQLTNGSRNIDILHNAITLSGRFGIQLENASAVRLAGNVVSDNADHGISVTAGTSGCTFEDNESARNGLPGGRTGDGIYFYGATENVLRRNRFHHNQSSGEDMQVGANGNVSVQNLSWLNGLTGFNHLGATGNVHNGDVAFYNNWDGFAMDFGSTGQTIVNCIAVVNGIVHSRYNLQVDSSSTAGLVSNDNVFWHPSGETPVRYAGETYQWLTDYSRISGQDTRSVQDDPLFVDPFEGDFHLQPRSLAIDNANSDTPSWSETDFEGRQRVDDRLVSDGGLGPVAFADRGAFEYIPPSGPPVPPDTVPRLDHIILIIMENKAYDKVRFASYTADFIARSSSFSQSYAYAHQSQSDYYAIWAATGRAVTESICPAIGSPYYTENLGHLCETHGRSWKAYSEDLPGAGDPICSKRDYVRRHCPWTDWGNLDHMNERPYEDLARDMAAGTLPNLAMVVPNLCNDTHNYCGQDTIIIGDNWLSRNVPAMVEAVGPRGLVILTWDEDDGSDGNHILTVFSSPLAKTGYVSKRYINFFTVVRTITDALGLPAFAEAAMTNPITDVWVKAPVTEPPPPAPKPFRLGPSFPNPSQGTMSATLELPSQVSVEATIFDLTGRRVKNVVSGTMNGQVLIHWDGTDDAGHTAHSGIYMLRVRAGSTDLQTKMLLVR